MTTASDPEEARPDVRATAPQRIAVVGATGRTGRCVVELALGGGHTVCAISRHPQAMRLRHPALDSRSLDLLDASEADVAEALKGCDAVISAVGVGTSRAPTELYSKGTSRLLRAMSCARIAVVSAVPVGGREGHGWLERRVAIPVLQRLFESTYEDMRRMERLLAASGSQWSALRPPRLLNRPATGRHRVAQRPLAGARSITCGDLAAALLEAVDPRQPPLGIAYVAP